MMMDWARDLFPICRSITGPGTRKTLAYIQNLLPDLQIHSVPSGTQAFGWTVPDEWTIRDAYVARLEGEVVIDFDNNNLALVGYSAPIDEIISREELLTHLYSAPGCIPYVTSYYKRNWGFCCSEDTKRALNDDKYHVYIDGELKPGNLNYGELIIPGNQKEEVLFSTYICHPSMANDNLSGIVVLIALAQWLQTTKPRYTYRFVFAPETIGSIVYISRTDLSRVIAGYTVSRVGTKGHLRFTNTRRGGTLSDRVARAVSDYYPQSFLYRGSDERQFNYPETDLPICALTRGDFPEYHSSLDTLDIISEPQLLGTLNACKQIAYILENNRTYRPTTKCEPHMGSLYPPVGNEPADMMNVLAYSDGRDLIDLSEIIGVEFGKCARIAEQLEAGGFLGSNTSLTAQSKNTKNEAGK